MRKTSAYARKRARLGPLHIFNATEWMNTINRSRSYADEPLEGFFPTKDAAIKSDVVVREALQRLLDCAMPTDPEHDHDLLAHALGVSIIRALQIKPNDNPMIPVLKDATDAVRRAIARYQDKGTWGLDGPGRTALLEGIDLYSQILHLSSPAQMTKATEERMKILARVDPKRQGKKP